MPQKQPAAMVALCAPSGIEVALAPDSAEIPSVVEEVNGLISRDMNVGIAKAIMMVKIVKVWKSAVDSGPACSGAQGRGGGVGGSGRYGDQEGSAVLRSGIIRKDCGIFCQVLLVGLQYPALAKAVLSCLK